MVEVSIQGDVLALEVLGWSKLWCLKSRLKVPLRCIRHVSVDGELPSGFWLRLPGTEWPGVIRAGSYWGGSRWSFWDVRRNRDNVIVIELSDWKYDYVVIEVNNPAVTLHAVQSALERFQGH